MYSPFTIIVHLNLKFYIYQYRGNVLIDLIPKTGIYRQFVLLLNLTKDFIVRNRLFFLKILYI